MSKHILWRDWTPGAFADARIARKPVLLSLVTAWSVECAAMERATFADTRVIAAVNGEFIPVRVDADRRPDVNERFNLGGWPTTAFLSGAGELLGGATYLEAPQMIDTLQKVSAACRERGDRLWQPRRVPIVRPSRGDAVPVGSAVDAFESLLRSAHDRDYGGFGMAPKLPHFACLQFAFGASHSLPDDPLAAIADEALESAGALWNPAGGFHRYADHRDWSDAALERTLDDNAAALHACVEAALTCANEPARIRAAELVAWLRDSMADASGAFYNARGGEVVDRTIYVDRNAAAISALFHAAVLFDDPLVARRALQAIEAVIVPAYRPGQGVAHVVADGVADDAIRGLLGDQVHATIALVWAHAATGDLPYSMLAAEIMEFAIRTMWDASGRAFRDRVEPDDPLVPFELNCRAACALDRLAAVTGNGRFKDLARQVLESLSDRFPAHGLFGACYALAVSEVIHGRRPARLTLDACDWQLG